MKILVYANAPTCKTAYGIHAHKLAVAFRDMGHDVMQITAHGLNGGGTIVCDDIPCMATDQADPIQHFEQQEADFIFAFHDLWSAHPKWYKDAPWVVYFPIDREPMPVGYSPLLDSLLDRIVYTQHGVDTLAVAGHKASYIPCAFDENEYFIMDKKLARQRIGFPQDCNIFGLVADNNSFPSRKAYIQQLSAFAAYAEHDPTAKLYVHALTTPKRGGEDLVERILEIEKHTGYKLLDKMIFADQYSYSVGSINSEWMNCMFNAIDCLLSASAYEGFCLPLIEAQSVGTPVITGGWLATKENFYKGQLLDKTEDAERTPLNIGGYGYTPRIRSITTALFRMAGTFKETGKTEAREELRERVMHYEYKNVINKFWKPKLEEIENLLHINKEVTSA